MALTGARVAVIGGGLGGLTAARALANAGADAELLEARDRVGGVVRTESIDGFACECAANGALSGVDDGLLDLAAELGVATEPASPAARNRWILVGGKLRALPTNPLALITSDLLTAQAKLRLLAEPLRSSLRGDVTVAEFFRHRLGDEVHERIVAPFVTGVFAGDSERLSLAAAFPRIAELASRGGLLRGMIAARRAGKRPERPRLAAPSGGMGQVIDALAAELGNRIRTDSPVAAVARTAGGVELTLASGVREKVDAAVLALPAAAAGLIVADADRELGELLTTIETVPVAVVHLGYRRDQIDHPLDGFGFLVAGSEPLPVLGAVFESTLWPARAPEGSVLLRCMIGGARRPELVDRDDAELIDLATGAVDEVLGTSGGPILANVVKWPRAVAQYTVGHGKRVERAEALAAAQNAVLAGSSYRGVALNAICADAARVVRSVAQILATPLALLLMFSLLNCSGAEVNNNKSGKGDGGDHGEPVTVGGDATGTDGYRVIAGDISGAVAVRVVMKDPPAAWVTSPGANGCKLARRAPLVVDTHGGVLGAAVWLDGVEAGKQPPADPRRRISFERCALAPRVQSLPRPGSVLEVASASEQRVELALRRLGDEDVLARFPLAPIGRAFEVGLGGPGVYQVDGPEIDPAWAVVSTAPYIGVTNRRGRYRFKGVADGTYTLRVWHPPVTAGGEPLVASAEVAVADGAAAKVEVALAKKPEP